VLAKITGVFAKQNISIVQIEKQGVQQEDGKDSLYIVTNKTLESSINRAIAKINQLGIATVQAVVRVEQ
jgi:predicted regulator of amino acid metabolism with ACT domain